jgi:hypothetical protein
MKAIPRMAAVVLAVTSLVLVTVGAANAADPLIGGTLATTGDAVTIESHSTMPVYVTFEVTAPGVTVDPLNVTLQPGATGTATISGPLVGKLQAHLVQIGDDVPGDKAAVTLEVGIKPYVPPFDPKPFVAGFLGIAALLFLAYRFRRVRIHITTSRGTPA